MVKKDSFMKGVFTLAVAGIIVRITGFLYRVPLTRLIGAEGIGIYQLALPVFTALHAISVGGIAVAVANLVAEYTAKGRYQVAFQTMRLATVAVVVLGGAASVILILGARTAASLLGNPEAYYSLLVLAPALFFFALESCYRYYFLGRQLMMPSATALVMEQGLRITGTLTMASWLLPLGLDMAAAGVAFGTDLGAMGSLFYLLWCYRRVQAHHQEGRRWDWGEPNYRLLRRLWTLAWPVTLGLLVLPMLNLADVAIIQRRLHAVGYTVEQATALYGAYTGMAMTLVSLPSVVIYALSQALHPAVSEANTRGDSADILNKVTLAIRATVLLCLPAGVGLALLARPLVTLIFREPSAVAPLLWVAPVALLQPLHIVGMSALEGLGNTGKPMRNLAFGMVIKLIIDFYLTGVPGINIRGPAIGLTVCYFVASWLNFRDLAYRHRIVIPWRRVIVGPAISALVMGLVIWWLRGAPGIRAQATWVAAMAILAFAPLVYGLILLGSGGVTRRDLREMGGPAGPWLERWVGGLPFVRD